MTSTPAAAPPSGTVLARIAALQRMDASALREQWETLMGTPPMPGSAASLRQRLVHRIQELAYGGLAPAVQVTLEQVARRDAGEAERPQALAVTPGTRFIREWRGRRHEVTALADGFEYLGTKHKSLTAVAKAITGQHTNGKVFFGLKKRSGK